jgi:hypothetical protein
MLDILQVREAQQARGLVIDNKANFSDKIVLHVDSVSQVSFSLLVVIIEYNNHLGFVPAGFARTSLVYQRCRSSIPRLSYEQE